MLIGSAGKEVYRFDAKLLAGEVDVIAKFQKDEVIELSTKVFLALGAKGELDPEMFYTRATEGAAASPPSPSGS